MPQSTVFSILMILLAKRKVSRDYLAERFSVSKRTVSRYLSTLADAGIPIESIPGVNGGVCIADDFMLDKTVLSDAESVRIRDALERTSAAYGDKVNTAIIEKLDCLNKSKETDSFAIKQDDLYIDCDYNQAEKLKPKIRLLSQAIRECRVCDIKYTDARGIVSYRKIEPHTLVFKNGAWYIYAMCDLRGDFRLFKLLRISDIRLTSQSFVRRTGNLTEKLELEYYNEVYTDIEFEFFPAVQESVIDWLGEGAVSERGTKLVASAEVPLNSSLYKRLLSYGSSIKILAPAEIRERLIEEAKLMLGKYVD
ncbi:MAG: YafY family transcriptional regulator [Clostridiales bacterium]|nr:YafY family transcriptional regulator [Clostridiales bacterium]